MTDYQAQRRGGRGQRGHGGEGRGLRRASVRGVDATTRCCASRTSARSTGSRRTRAAAGEPRRARPPAGQHVAARCRRADHGDAADPAISRADAFVFMATAQRHREEDAARAVLAAAHQRACIALDLERAATTLVGVASDRRHIATCWCSPSRGKAASASTESDVRRDGSHRARRARHPADRWTSL